jgi:hypothetical protein
MNMQTSQSHGPLARLLPAVLLTSAFSLACIAQTETGGQVDAVRVSLEKIMESRKVLSKEKKDWILGKDMLESQIDVLKKEVETLQARIADADKSVQEAKSKFDELVSDRDRLRQASDRAKTRLVTIEASVHGILPQLPDPLKEDVKVMAQRIPAPGAETRLTVAERYQAVVFVLNKINKFNREVVSKPELREISPGVMAEVTALYFGLGQAYYATAKGDAAGVGRPGQSGWIWEPINNYGKSVARMVAVLRNDEPAAFIQAPVSIK